jgi:SAM-dependent methyltransferase
MSFTVDPDAYDRFMGRYSAPLAPGFADVGAIEHGLHVLDVGCGTGALTAELVRRLGPGRVAAVDPSERFVAALRDRQPGVEVRQAAAEVLPFEDGTFDAALAQLVVHFMADPIAGLREMARVTRAGGVVAACVWDHAGRRGPLSPFWRAARDLDPDVQDESRLAGVAEGHLGGLFEAAGMRDVENGGLTITVEHATFDAWWEPFTLGVGPAGDYVTHLDESRRTALRDHCRELLPDAPFSLSALAWTARGHA